MSGKNPCPGVSREARVCGEGLERLENHLQRGARITPVVLMQWIRRYGEPARALLRQYGRYSPEIEP